jgi:F-type H+-transporting ATPase subunit b
MGVFLRVSASPRQLLAFVFLLLLSSVPALAQQPAAGETHLKAWEWANFLILAGGLGYLAGKRGGPFFAARSSKIRQDMIEAAELRKQAEDRAAEMERRLAGIESHIAGLREESRNQARAEAERIARQTATEVAKIQAQAEQDIALAAKTARNELKRHSAELAVALAERLIRARMTPAAQDELVREFVRNLDRPSTEPGPPRNS